MGGLLAGIGCPVRRLDLPHLAVARLRSRALLFGPVRQHPGGLLAASLVVAAQALWTTEIRSAAHALLERLSHDTGREVARPESCKKKSLLSMGLPDGEVMVFMQWNTG